jgi:hypothetical protein
MSNPSNLYAEKVFAEHPVALWPLDDSVDYISLISEANRDLTTWTISGGTAELKPDTSEEPFINSYVTELDGDVPVDNGQISCISNFSKNFQDLDLEIGTFSFGSYFYSMSESINSIDLGYVYEDPDTLEEIVVTKTINTPIQNRWFFISEIFEFPDIDQDFNLIININYDPLSGSPEEGSFKFLVNGISFGQNSEEFQAQSLGVSPVALPEQIAIDVDFGVEANVYGLQELSGYYLANDKKLFAKNSGMPMVYGASNITKIIPNNGDPSLILPGLGFLNKTGQYKEYTAEMWIRLSASTTEPKRIFGPIASDDGIYVDGAFLGIKVGDAIGFHYVGEWFRPMLIQFEVINNSASLILNGEQVIELSYLTSDLDLPTPLDESNRSQDWLGVYGYDDVFPFDLDCVAIYGYQVPEIVAKRRFVYGQGVEFPENINASYNGESVFIDYSFANYANNYLYPEIGGWNQGISENVLTNNRILSTPNYPLPQIKISNRTQDQLFDALLPLQTGENFISLKPNAEWNDTNSHIFFENIAFLRQQLKSFFMVFETQSTATEQTLFEIYDDQTNNRLSATILNGVVDYKLYYGNEEIDIHSESGYANNVKNVAGLDFLTTSSFYGKEFATFLGLSNRLKMYVGGNRALTNTFSGKIYRLGFSTKKNYQSFSEYFGENGFANALANSTQESQIASYTLMPTVYLGKFKLDVNVNSYWEDYVPLTYFAKFVDDSRGDSYYDLDFIQLNVNYPSSNKYIQVEGIDYVDTSSEMLRTFVSFQYIESGANANDGFFTSEQLPAKNGVIEPTGNWINTKYEFVDNMLIYPPSGVDFNDLAIVFHFEFNITGATSKQVKVRSFQLASQSFNESSPNNIGTRFGLPIFPYKKSGVYFDYSAKNPYTIYKGSSPYLYLTKTSGIELIGDINSQTIRGLSIPINPNLSDDYKIVAFQTEMMFSKDVFPEGKIQLFELQGKVDYIKFFAERIDNTGTRAKVYAINADTGRIQDGISFFWNGKLTKNPIITAQEWGILGIGFARSLNLDSYVGAFRLTGPLVVNAVSNYKSTGLQQAQEVARRLWIDVRQFQTTEIPWEFWADSYLWQDVLIVSSGNIYGVSPETIYKSYTGTNKFIFDDERPLQLRDYNYKVYKDVVWQSVTITPV